MSYSVGYLLEVPLAQPEAGYLVEGMVFCRRTTVSVAQNLAMTPHSHYSSIVFSGVDNVIEFNIITSTGSYLTVNSHQYSDLFWVLRSGGGGTFGVVTSVTYQTHPPVPIAAAIFQSTSTNSSTTKKLLTELIRIHPALADAGFGGYSDSSNTSVGYVLAALNGSEATVIQNLNPFLAFALNLSISRKWRI